MMDTPSVFRERWGAPKRSSIWRESNPGSRGYDPEYPDGLVFLRKCGFITNLDGAHRHELSDESCNRFTKQNINLKCPPQEKTTHRNQNNKEKI